jgi:hypothetical protein
MDPLTSLVTALAAGAAAALKPTVKQAVKDGNAALKGLIQRKYAQVEVNQLEANPSSKSRRGVVEEDLKAAEADTDAEVLQHAQALLEAIQRHAPETAAAIGVDLKEIEGTSLAIRRVIACGSRKLVAIVNRQIGAHVITPLAHSDDATHPLLALPGSGRRPVIGPAAVADNPWLTPGVCASDDSSGSIRSGAAVDGARAG